MVKNKLLLVSYSGGKGRSLKEIFPLIPDHFSYFEPFGGGGAVLLNKPPSKIEIYNDLDQGIVSIFRALQNEKARVKFTRRIDEMVFSRELFSDYLHSNPVELLEIACRSFYLLKCSFASAQRIFAYSLERSRTIKINFLELIIRRLKKVIIENLDWKILMDRFKDEKKMFMFVDPPYYKTNNKYTKGCNTIDYELLRDTLRVFKGKFLLTINDHPYINELFKEFKSLDVKVNYSSAKEGYTDQTEKYFYNYHLPQRRIEEFI